MERFVVGSSEKTEAEFGMRDTFTNKAFTAISFYDNEPVSVEGFDTIEEAIASFDIDRNLIEIL